MDIDRPCLNGDDARDVEARVADSSYLNMKDLACIDLFCGAGGLTHGLLSEGIPVVGGVDLDPMCRHAYETNNEARFIQQDVSRTPPEELRALYGDVDVRILAGCAPCQPFSTYAQRYDTTSRPEWTLLREFARLIEAIRPEIVTMENVPTVQRHDVYVDFKTTLERLDYHVWDEPVDCTAYGLPQRRTRLVLLASRLGKIDLVEPTHEANPMTVREAIERLPPLSAGETHPDDPLHTAARLSPLNLERIRASRPGGTWRDWPEHLRATCHRKASGKTYPSVYGRMEWDAPAPTLTTQFFGYGNGRFGHPEQDRAISLREGAILQGFPESYSFLPEGAPIHFRTLGRMIGNAVPVTLGKVIGRSIVRHLGTTASAVSLQDLDERDEVGVEADVAT
ncbi:MAG: cytosine-specific methyltransferase [Fimbriimonadales bacterium]|nr:MAG: cytosine-specific methyltransferase [Fimbriimonadales bacterium]